MKKFLVIQTAFLGDVILATPIIEKLHRFYPEAQIDVLVRKGNEGLLEHNPKINKLWIWDKKSGKYSNLRKLTRAFRGEKYDHLINLQRFGASGMMTAFSGAKEKIGFSKNPFSFTFDRKFEHRIGEQEEKDAPHETERNLQLIEHLTDRSSQRPKLYPSEQDFQAVEKFQSETFVTIAPTSVWFTKQWPPEKWQELIGRLSDYRIFLLGAPGDFDACESIRQESNHSKIENLAGKLSLLQSAALMSTAAMNYVNDSAPMHMASAMNAPVTAIYCSTIPEFGFGPLSEESYVVQIEEDLPCRPCGLHGYKACPKGHFKCAFDIKTENIPLPGQG
ncbi:glycosyltransferase family 9 protein [Halocola ammonii]